MKKTRQNKPKKTASLISFSHHLQELRRRTYVYLICVVLVSILGYQLRNNLIELITRPLQQNLFYSSPAGGFNFLIKLCFLFGFVVTTPLLLYETVSFIAPAFPKITLKRVVGICLASVCLVCVGVAFSFLIALPASLSFLSRFSDQNIKALISSEEYLSFVVRYVFGFALIFQFPLILVIINQFFKLKLKQLFSAQRWVILVSTVTAAIITPTPDVFNLTLMTLPPILLYQLTILYIYVANRRSPTPKHRPQQLR